MPNFDSEIEEQRQQGHFLIKSELFVRRAFDTGKKDPAFGGWTGLSTHMGALQNHYFVPLTEEFFH